MMGDRLRIMQHRGAQALGAHAEPGSRLLLGGNKAFEKTCSLHMLLPT